MDPIFLTVNWTAGLRGISSWWKLTNSKGCFPGRGIKMFNKIVEKTPLTQSFWDHEIKPCFSLRSPTTVFYTGFTNQHFSSKGWSSSKRNHHCLNVVVATTSRQTLPICFYYMGVSKNRGTPKWMVYKENPIKMDDLGVPLFLETTTYSSLKLFFQTWPLALLRAK